MPDGHDRKLVVNLIFRAILLAEIKEKKEKRRRRRVFVLFCVLFLSKGRNNEPLVWDE